MISKQHRAQIDNLIRQTIVPALSEDFDYKNQDEEEQVLNYLKKEIKKLKRYV